MKTIVQIVCFVALMVSAVSAASSKSNTGAKAESSAALKTKTQAIVRQHVESYYKTKYVAGSAGTRVMSATVKIESTEPIPGWSGRERTSGSVKLVVAYKGRQQEETRSFDATTEAGKIIDFTAK